MIFREPTKDDFALMADSFWREAQDACPGVGRLFLVAMLERVIADPRWRLAVLCDAETPEEVFCWAAWRSRSEVFWISVKPLYQGKGFARMMFEHIGIQPGDTIACAIIPRDTYRAIQGTGVRLLHRPYMALT